MSSALDKNPWLKLLISLGVGGTFFTSILYLSGKMYLKGYLSYWHLQEGIFVMPIHEVLYQSFLGLTTLGVWKGGILLVAVFIVFVAMLALNKFLTWVSKWRFRYFGLTKRDEKPAKNDKAPLHVPLLITAVSLLVFYVLFGVAVFAALSGSLVSSVGLEVAKNRHKELAPEANRQNLSKIFEFSDTANSSGSIKGEYIKCVSQRCLVLNGAQVIVVGSKGEIISQGVIKE